MNMHYWINQRLSDEHQTRLQQVAENERRAQAVQRHEPVPRRRPLLAKLRAELTAL